jgi:hypothetical protein
LLWCKKICAEKPSEGGHFCNCLSSKYPMFYSSQDTINSNESNLLPGPPQWPAWNGTVWSNGTLLS